MLLALMLIKTGEIVMARREESVPDGPGRPIAGQNLNFTTASPIPSGIGPDCTGIQQPLHHGTGKKGMDASQTLFSQF